MILYFTVSLHRLTIHISKCTEFFRKLGKLKGFPAAISRRLLWKHRAETTVAKINENVGICSGTDLIEMVVLLYF